MNVLVINGHPRKDSFSMALMHAYMQGASKAGIAMENIVISELEFDLNVTHFTPRKQFFEPCIIKAQQLIAWANHIVFIYPPWW